MERLNYHHLLYFSAVAREGSVARASRLLHVAQPTISAQVHALESQLGCKLLERHGRGLRITSEGKTVLQYAESIFALGGEMMAALAGGEAPRPQLAVGVDSALSPSLLGPLLAPLMASGVRLRMVEGEAASLATAVAARSLHCLLSCEPVPKSAPLASRLLLECPLEAYAPESMARSLRRSFPARLAGQKVLLPSAGAVRTLTERWLAESGLASCELQELVAGEMPRPELYAAESGAVVFAPRAAREAMKRQHGLVPVGELTNSCWRLWLVTPARGPRHAALDAVIAAAAKLAATPSRAGGRR